ncbi:hypothetical protein GQF61_04705 [Sphingobacterium sp. DK4209]|uniref:DUF3828 domain-containing protein n=1 Tax=Sphingobacterium zhuxiongii TaxID=2662364 RepID=A0A5Q0QAB2_9SPHI|nr:MULTISPECIES: hypothetical protein [unclassified Sphingobacterium]MVZ65142.1 hypothetical protein [Sphingobacterium sp. DK4209]QGA26089.1 hypothetical protein GFH32_07035 [Sphingobacterium sp. dk4302]
MKATKSLFILPATLLFFACQSNTKLESKNTADSAALVQDTLSTSWKDEGCSWLKTTVEKHFKTEDSSADMKAITTATYYEYKVDATNVDLDLDSSLTNAEFQKKWNGKFDTKFAGIGTGFLISGQDYGSITLSTCDFIHGNEQEATFKVLISDCQYNTDYNREITLVKDQHTYKIANVKEFD